MNRRDFLARVAAFTAGGTAVVALGTSVIGLGSPGPSSPGFSGAYLRLAGAVPPATEQFANGLTTFQNGPLSIGTIRGKSNSSFPGKITWVLDSDPGDLGVSALFVGNAASPDFSGGPIAGGALVFQGISSLIF